ncbi:DUF2807 domain-containing protein [Flavobacterium sp.]|uniref:GIN domain-containing protein n=1 Tax=Flavobacterium sp. TaxID=239 RepID=UPI0026091B67|nr:DUF2807 domain-containing protein [Flavobacterium sp.]MDD3004799.1 DUF2807 domain-containing protein [Flavobacterium sp.]
MKQIITSLAFLFLCTSALAQEITKLKGSKMVTKEQKATARFSSVYIQDNLQVTFIKSDTTGIETEADDNLHQVLKVENNGGILNLSLNDKVLSFKKFEVKLYYTDELKLIEANKQAKIMILEEMVLEEINFKLNEKAKLYLNLKANAATFEMKDNSLVELNGKAEKLYFILTQNASAKALVAATELKVDQYQKSKAALEGDVIDLKLRMDNNAHFIGKGLTAKNVQLIAEAYSSTTFFAETTCVLSAMGNAEVEIFGEPTFEIKKFSGNAVLSKKTIP